MEPVAKEGLRKVRVESIREIAPRVFVLEYGRFFDFEAGQIVSLSLRETDDPRMYSIASGERDERVQILFNIVDDGKLTPGLASLKVGDCFFSSKGFGKFTGTGSPAFWIAQGTGIAPFASMFRSGQDRNKILIHGGRFESSFYFAGEFEPRMGERYIRCCTRGEFPGSFNGRVTDYLKSKEDLPPDYLYYLCGSTEMVVDTRDILISKGIPYRQIVGEIYF
jgi:ferredoxin--NADP+ reductase